jgi:hypothetical protein
MESVMRATTTLTIVTVISFAFLAAIILGAI